MDEESLRIDALLHDVALKLPFSRITPQNISKLERSFLRSKTVPAFTYSEKNQDLETMRSSLEQMSFSKKSPVQVLLEQKRQELIMKLHMISSVGEDDFTKYASKVYPQPSKSLVDKAYEFVELGDSAKSPYISRIEARRRLRHAMTAVGFHWKIQSQDMSTSAKVEPIRGVLSLRKKERFRLRFVDRLAVHEIGTHAARAENGRLQPLLVFVNGLGGYLDTEEGLAAYNEERAGLLDNLTLKTYAGRVIAVNHALDNSFMSVYKELKPHFTAKQATKIVFRVKRGVKDPQAAGAFTRDSAYLRGYLRVKQFVEKQDGWIHDLMLGKIAIEHVDLVKKIPGVIPARYLPEPIFDLVK